LILPANANAQDTKKLEALAQISQTVDVQGIQLVYSKNGKSQAYNWGTIDKGSTQKVTSNTIFEAASLSKCVFTYAVLRLYDRGVIDLDKSLLSYIGKYDRFDPADKRYEKITARMVLSHHTGLPNWGDNKGARLMFTPDSCFSYSGEGFVFLQHVLEHITGKTLNQIAGEEVFTPLHMSNSSYMWTAKFDTVSAFGNSADQIKWHSGQNAAASLLTNAVDYTKFLQALASGYGLKPETHKMMLSNITEGNWYNRRTTAANAHIWWGLGIGIQENEKGRAIWHWGDNGDFKAFYILFPDKKESLVYFTHNYRGLHITPDVIDLFLGKQTTWAAQWDGEGFDNLAAMKAYRAELQKQGYDKAPIIYSDLKKKDSTFDIDREDLNDLGFILLHQDKNKEALSIFKYNLSMNPGVSNLYDSVAEAYEKLGEKKLAAAHYRKCVELNPKNEFAKEHLKKVEAAD